MIIPKVICDYLDLPRKTYQFEATLIDNLLCDECYKVGCTYSSVFPKKCLVVVSEYEIQVHKESLNINIIKATIKSVKVNDHSYYLCYADHSTQVVQAIQKSKHSQVVKKLSNEESFTLPEVVIPVSNPIGFGMKSSEKSLKFSRERNAPKVLQSQDDILSAIDSCSLDKKEIENEKKEEDEFPDFPDWALAFLMNKYKV